MFQNCNVIINHFHINGSALNQLPKFFQPVHQPKQTSNYKKKNSGPLLPTNLNQSQINQIPINKSMHLQPTIGQIPYYSHNQEDPNFSDIHSFNLLERGKGIDKNEYYYITHAANEALQAKEDPLSNGIIKRIKKSIGGEWMVCASVKGLKGYDFSLSIVTGNDFLQFTIGNYKFHVCRLRD